MARRLGAAVLLESADGITMQLRDDRHQWGIFGGMIEEGEDPKDAALREIGEELTIRLDPQRLTLLKVCEGELYTTWLFHYPVERELDDAILTEGIRFETKTPQTLKRQETVPWHWEMICWYWRNRGEYS